MGNPPKNTPARRTKTIMLGVAVAGVLFAFVSCLAQSSKSSTPEVGFAANQERFSGPDWDAYAAGHAMSRPHMFDAEVPASVAQRPGDDTLASAMKADKANAVWWCDNNMPDDLVDEHSDELEALYGGCVDGLLPDAVGRPESYGVD